MNTLVKLIYLTPVVDFCKMALIGCGDEDWSHLIPDWDQWRLLQIIMNVLVL